MPYRILILEPVRDEAAARRETHVREEPSLQPHVFEHLYAAEYVPLDQTQPMQTRLMRSQGKALDEDALLHRLNERLAAFNADILLVNSGALFGRYPDEVMSLLRSIKRLVPALRIGFHPRPFEKQGPKPFLEYTNELGRLMADVFSEARK